MEIERPTVLVIGRQQHIMAHVTNLLENGGYQAIGALTDEEAFQKFRQHQIDAVIIGGGVEESSRTLFRTTFLDERPSLPILVVFAGSSDIVTQLNTYFPKAQ